MLSSTVLACAAAPGLAAGAWQPESPLASPLREATGPGLAVASTGAAVAGWQGNLPDVFGNVDAYVASRSTGAGPIPMGGLPQGVASPKSHTAGDMGVTAAVSPSGKAVVAWVQATYTGSFRVQAVVRPAGMADFGPVQTLTAEGADATTPAVAMNAAGQAVLAWRRHDTATSSWPVQAAALDVAGVTFTALNAGGNVASEPADTDAYRGAVHVAVAPDGSSVVAWDAYTTGAVPVARWAWRSPAALAFNAAHDIGAGTRATDVAAGAGNTFALSWVTGSGGTGATVSVARLSSDATGSPLSVGSSPGSVTATRVGVDGAGDATVAFLGTTTTGIDAKPRVAITTCAATCPAPAYLTDTAQEADGLALAMNDAGDAVAVWTRSNGTRRLVEASLRSHGAGWDPAVFISRSDQDAYTPVAGIDGGGNVTVAWMAANVALWSVRQTTGAVAGATTPPAGPADPGPGGGGGTGGPPAPPAPPAPQPSSSSPPADRTVIAAVTQGKVVRATTAGRFAGPRVACREAPGGRCRVVVRFTAQQRKGKKTSTIAAGGVTFTLIGGAVRKPPAVALTRPARLLLAATRKLALRGTVTITDAAGNRRVYTVTTTVTPPPPPRKGASTTKH